MTFSKLVSRVLSEESDNDIITTPSGARFWGDLAIPPQAKPGITLDQSKDYGIPPSNYKKIGEGSGSVVYSDNEIIVKLGKSRIGSTWYDGKYKENHWEDELRGRIKEHERLKRIESISPFPVIREGTFVHYSDYKDGRKKPLEGSTYNKQYKGFGIFDEYKFSTAGSRILDNGIIEQQVIDTDLYKIKDRNLLNKIGGHIKEHIGHVDVRGISGNIFLDVDNKIIYVIDN